MYRPAMDCSGCCKSGTFNVPAFLSIYNAKPTRTKIYFPDSHVDSLGISLLEREERRTKVLPWAHTRVTPQHSLRTSEHSLQVSHTSTFINSRKCKTQATSKASEVSVIKSITNQLGHEIHKEHTSESSNKTIQPQISCKVDTALSLDSDRETLVQIQQNQEIQFSCGLAEENEIKKQDPEVYSLYEKKGLDQLPRKYKPGSRVNAWKGPSYTELITAAILSTKDRKMTVSQIYDWLMQNVPYFKDRKHYESYRGWKVRNLIRSDIFNK